MTFLVFSIIWSQFVAVKLYVSTDPIYLLDIIPPFVDTKFGDHFVANEAFVWILWLFFIVAVITLPYFFTQKLKNEVK